MKFDLSSFIQLSACSDFNHGYTRRKVVKTLERVEIGRTKSKNDLVDKDDHRCAWSMKIIIVREVDVARIP